MSPTPLNIGQSPQLLVDNYVVEIVNFVTRTMHQPTKHPQNPLLKKDRPWEILPYIRNNTNVHWDEQEGLFKCWYEDMAWDYDEFMRLQRAGAGRAKREVAGMESYERTIDNRLLYAESRDGIQWLKPELDYRQTGGMKTNICFGNKEHGKIHACTVLRDPLESDDSRRYKALYWNSKVGLADSKIAVASSRDGRSWTPYDEPLVIGQIPERQLGDVICLSADTATGEYYLDTRARAMQEPSMNPKHPTVGGWGPAYYPGDPYRMSKRRVFSSVTRNILNWPVLHEMLAPNDVDDNLDDEFYGLVRFRIGDLWLGLLPVFRRTRNMTNLHLVYSRDGFNWNRVDRSMPLIENGPEGAWDCYMAEIGTAPIFLEDEIRIYYSGANLHHDWWMFGEQEGLDVPEARPGWNGGETAMGLATLRPEGFVSIDATAREGILATRPLVSDGGLLRVNAACRPKGYLGVEIADAGDEVVPGYGRAACDTFTGDSTDHVVAWNGVRELPREVLSSGAKLRFFSRHCSMYSFRVTDA